MALKVTEQKGTFFLEGRLNNVTAKDFQTHLEFILYSYGMVTINIENLIEIDKTGMAALKALYNYAKYFDRKFYVVGIGCKEIYDEFEFKNVA